MNFSPIQDTNLHRHEQFMFGNASLHIQLSTALAVMTQLIVNSSQPRSAQELSESLDLSVRYLRKLLRTLAAGDLVEAHDTLVDTWICTRPAHTVSLADLYQCVISSKEGTTSPFLTSPQMSSSDLLMMQATMSVNQTVLQNLQQFDLGRLKVAESAMLFTESLRQRARHVARRSEALVE